MLLLLLLLEHLLLFYAFTACHNLSQSSANIIELKVGTCHGASVLLIAFLLRVDAFVIGEVDIINVFVVISHFDPSVLCVLFRKLYTTSSSNPA